MKQRYTVPTHMNLPDRLLFGLTVRQLLTLLTGLSLSYQCWQALRFLDDIGPSWLFVRIGVSALPTLASVVVAFVVMWQRPLELWALVWFRYVSQPKTYTWQSTKEAKEADALAQIPRQQAPTRRQEKLTGARGGKKG